MTLVNTSDSRGSEFVVFISYSRSNAKAADAIADGLQSEGFEPRIDRRALPFGEAWKEELKSLIETSDTVLWLVSPDSINSTWCAWELDFAKTLNKRMMPIMISQLPIEELPRPLSAIHALPQEGTYSQERDMPLLTKALRTDNAWLKDHTRFDELARQWRSAGQSKDRLLRGSALRSAEAWRERQPETANAPTSDTQSLLAASRKAQGSRLRLALFGSLTVSVGAVSLALVAWQQNRLAQQRMEAAAFASNRVVVSLVDAMSTSGMPLEYLSRPIEIAQRLLTEIAPDNINNEEVIWSRSAAYQALGEVQMRTNNHQGAYDSFLRAVDLRRAVFAQNPGAVDIVADLTRSLDGLAGAATSLGHTEESVQIRSEIMTQREALVAARSGELEPMRLLASALTRAGAEHEQAGDIQSARENLARAQSILRQIVGLQQHRPIDRIDLARNLMHSSDLLEDEDKGGALLEARDLLRFLAQELPDDASVRIKLSQVLGKLATITESPENQLHFREGWGVISRLAAENRVSGDAQAWMDWYQRNSERYLLDE